MLAQLNKLENGLLATFERLLYGTKESVWKALTYNVSLKKWKSNLEIVDLKENGTIHFHMNDGTDSSLEIKIRDYKEEKVLEFEWGDGWIRFELYPKDEGCLVVVKEYFSQTTSHTAKDLSGWHICLVMLDATLKEILMEFPKSDWEKYYQLYKEEIHKIAAY